MNNPAHKQPENNPEAEAIAKMKELGVDGFSPAMEPEAVLQHLKILENRSRVQAARRLGKSKE